MHMAKAVATTVHASNGCANVAQRAGASAAGGVIRAVASRRAGRLGAQTVADGTVFAVVGVNSASRVQMILCVYDKSAAKHDAAE